jgi:hypothetical protein
MPIEIIALKVSMIKLSIKIMKKVMMMTMMGIIFKAKIKKG